MEDLPELRECSKKAYEAWKAELATKGKTPTDAVAYCRSIGMVAYADMLAEIIALYSKQRQDPVPDPAEKTGNLVGAANKKTNDEGDDRSYRVQYCKLILKALLFFLLGFFFGRFLSLVLLFL